jgi:hypothetical protein
MKNIWKENKTAVIVTGSILFVAVGAVLAISLGSKVTPPDPKKEPKKTIKFLASKDFSSMPMEDKQEYMRKMRESGDRRMFRNSQLTQEERTQLHQNMRPVFRTMMKERMKKFFAMSKEEQNKELDKAIARMKERQAQREARRRTNTQSGTSTNSNSNNNNNRRRWGGGNVASRMKNRYENTDPATRAQMIEYRKAIRDRMQGKR